MEIEARYSNYVEIGQNAFEFILHFGQLYDEGASGVIFHTRIATTPFCAKQFADLLSGSIRQHEAEFGQIPSPTAPAGDESKEK